MAATDSNGALGKYKLIAELGHGGMAQVFLALASGPAGFNKLVVIKQIRAQFAEDPEFLSMFLDEARLAARLNHPNVVQTNEVGEDDGRYFICMEYLEGQPLNRVLTRLGSEKAEPADRLTLRQQLLVLQETLTGLHHAHELCDFDGTALHVVHRDMSPHNVFVTYAGQVKVVDFGIAKALSSSSETRTGVLKGKIGYMAPEQAMGERVDRRADIFSVGMILWEMITGRRMFKGVPDVAVLQKIVNGDIPTPRSIAPDMPERLEAICMKALSRNREERYFTASEFAADLEAAMNDLGGKGSLRDLGKTLERQFDSDRQRIKALVEASHAGSRVHDDQSIDVRRTGSGPRARPSLPVIEAPLTESMSAKSVAKVVEAAAAAEPTTGGNRPSPSSLTANTSDGPPTGAAKNRTAMLAGVVGLVGAGLAAALFLSRGGDPPKPAEAPAASATVAPQATAHTMRIESSPPGASVSEGATVLGKTPLEVVLDPSAGTRHLVVSLDGYAPYPVTQEPAKENVRLVVPLVPVPKAAPAKASAEPSAEPKAKSTPPPPPPPRVPVTPPPQKPPPPSDINMNR